MANYKITQNRKGELQAKIQVSGKDNITGNYKVYTKRVYNKDNLTEAKFRKQVDKAAIAFEEEITRALEAQTLEIHTHVLTFAELMAEWQESIKANFSKNYYERSFSVANKFNVFLQERHLDKRPISDITVRDVQMFLNSFSVGYSRTPLVRLKKDLPNIVNYRELARANVITRCSSYGMRRKGNNIELETAQAICNYYSLNMEDYFDEIDTHKPYALETIKGYRRILRTVFNEAIRYEWITKNPVCATKIGAGNVNISLRSVPEKEVFSFKEAKEFLAHIDAEPEQNHYKVILFKIMLLTGVRTAELCGLRWSDVDFNNKVLHIRRNRIYSALFGIYEKDPKTKTSTRDIPLPDALANDLDKFMDWFRLADDNFDNKLDEYYIACNMRREPIFPHIIGQWLKSYERKWGVKEVTNHGLRHTYCSLLLSQNVPIQTVSKYMGHSDSTVTLQVYSHFIPDTKNLVVTALNSLTD